jgi:predicted nuclease of predicted toxin-antitoxin system
LLEKATVLLLPKIMIFNDILHLNGYPPKILLLRIGNCKTKEITELLDRNMSVIQELLEEDVGIIELEQN